LGPDDLKVLVDVRENEKGTLQWVVLVASDARIALGVHTWIEGYLSPVYRDTLQALAKTGYGSSGGYPNRARRRAARTTGVIAGINPFSLVLPYRV